MGESNQGFPHIFSQLTESRKKPPESVSDSGAVSKGM